MKAIYIQLNADELLFIEDSIGWVSPCGDSFAKGILNIVIDAEHDLSLSGMRLINVMFTPKQFRLIYSSATQFALTGNYVSDEDMFMKDCLIDKLKSLSEEDV